MASEINVGSLFNDQATMDLPQQAPLRTETFGARSRRLRRSRRLSQAELASALNVSAPAISGWEKGRARPRHGRVAALGKMLGVSTAELLGSDDREFAPDLLAASRADIARVVGTTPDKVRILIEF